MNLKFKSLDRQQEESRANALASDVASVLDHLGLLLGDPLAGADDLASGQALAKQALFVTVNTFIQRKPDGSPRYDTNLKLNLLAYAQANGMTGPAASVQTWISTVQAAYFTAKANIEAAETIEAVRAALPGYADLEERFGVAGSEQADPDVCTGDLSGE